jgi:hypothetical protein
VQKKICFKKEFFLQPGRGCARLTCQCPKGMQGITNNFQPDDSSTPSSRQPAESSTTASRQPATSSTPASRQPATSSTPLILQPASNSPLVSLQPAASNPPARLQPAASNPPARLQPAATNPPASVQRAASNPPASLQRAANNPPASRQPATIRPAQASTLVERSRPNFLIFLYVMQSATEKCNFFCEAILCTRKRGFLICCKTCYLRLWCTKDSGLGIFQ